MGPMDDLPTLIGKKDHLGVLRYIRAHQLRESKLAVEHGQALMGKDLTKSWGHSAEIKYAVLEQICLSALDEGDDDLAELCLTRLKEDKEIVDPASARFRRLLARCLEASEKYEDAEKIYDDFLNENPANLVALQRKYCIAKAKGLAPEVIVGALNEVLGQNMADVSGWWEMFELRMSYGDYKQAAYSLEQVILGCPLDPEVHRELAEVYAMIGGIENLVLARKHMAQSLELDSSNVRTQWGLVSVASQYLEAAASTKKNKKHLEFLDDHELAVAKELVRYGASEVLKSYKGDKKFAEVKAAMADYTNSLD